MKIVIIDDELHSRELLQSMLLHYCEGVQVAGMAANVPDGIRLIRETGPEMIFLDIEMPGGDGFKVLQAFPDPQFKVVFVTGFSRQDYADYALAALAWLHKPVSLVALQQTVGNCGLLPRTTQPQLKWLQERREDSADTVAAELLLLSGTEYERIRFSDIRYLEAHRAYAAFHLADGQERLASFPLAHYEKILPGDTFFRIHKSFLVNLDHVAGYTRERSGKLQLHGGGQLPVAARRKTQFVRLLKASGREVTRSETN